MANEYYAIILELSPRKINVGFAGEASPLVSIRPDTPLWEKFQPPYEKDVYPRFFDLSSHSLTKEQKEELSSVLKNDKADSLILEKYQHDSQNGSFTFWELDGFRALGRLMKYVVVRNLMVSPCHVKIMVLDSGASALEKFQLCSVLLGPSGCACSVYFIPRASCISMAASVEDSVVVDFQWLECRISALSELRVVKEKCVETYSEETACYKMLRTVSDAEEAREKVNEGHFLSFKGLPEVLELLVEELAVDVRPKMVQNLVFTGDIALSVELQRSLVKEVQLLLPRLTVSGKYCLGAWAGASIYCSTSLLKHDMNDLRNREVTREKLRNGKWKSIFIG